MNKSQQIRDYAAAHPTARAKDISTALGMKNAYVHSVLWSVKRTGVKKPATKKATPMPKLPEVGDTVGGLVFTRLSNGRFRWLPPAIVPMPEPKQLEMFEPKADPVNHPAHYKYGGIETIDFIEAKELGYNLGNVVKYITRADHKGNRKQDLEKAMWYLTREINSIK
jgi:hypothetical protein